VRLPPRSLAVYLALSIVSAVLVFFVVRAIFALEQERAGLTAASTALSDLVRETFTVHLASFLFWIAFSIVAAVVAHRVAAVLGRTLEAEAARVSELAMISDLSARLSGLLASEEITSRFLASLRQALATGTTATVLRYEEALESFRVEADDGPGAGGLAGQQFPSATLPPLLREHLLGRGGRLLVNDTAVAGTEWEAACRRIPSLRSSRSFAALPLRWRDRLIGALLLRDDRPGAIPPRRLATVGALAEYATGALHNTLTVAEAEARAEREALVNRISQRARASLESDEVLQRTVEDLGRALRVSRVLVALGTGPDDLRVAYEWTADNVARLGAGSQQLPVGRVAARGARTVVVNDTDKDERFADRVARADLAALDTRAALAAPIGMAGRLIGALVLDQVGKSRSWTSEEVRLVEAVAAELRIAMETVRLFQARKRESDRMLALHHASALLAGQTDPSVVLEETLRGAVRLIGHGGASLYVWVPEAKVLRLVRDWLGRGAGAQMLRAGQDAAGLAFERVAPFIVNDYQHWEGVMPAAVAAGQRAALAVPLVRNAQAIGAITVRSYDAAIRFTEDDAHLLTLYADLAVAALSAAEAFEHQRGAVVELERLSQAKSDFVSIVSHEFRTPLTGIQGFSELLRDEDLTSAEVREYAADINKDAQRLNRMITEMLDLDRLESGRMTLTLASVNLNEVIAEVADLTRPNAPHHPITLRLDEALPNLSGDRDRLTQVVTNLLSNAIKYSPDGGEVVVTSRRDGGSAHVAVRDRGIGIPADSLEKVFERYARLESKATRNVQGTGLGLPIVRQIVEMHGGRAWAESTLGEGSTVQFSIPLTAPPAAA